MIPASTLVLLITQPFALAGNTWDGGAGTVNWSDGNNWNANGAPAYGTLVFSGNTQTTNNNNSITAMNQVNWNGTAAWVMNGSVTLSLFDNGGTQAKLESLGSGGVTINANITFAANNGAPPNPFGEINAVNSNIAFTGGTLTVNGSSVNGIKFFGGAGRDVSFANTVSASGKWFGFTNANGSSVTIASGGNVTTGDFYVMNGNTLNLSGGTLTTSAVRLGGDFGNTGNQNQTLGGTFALTPLTGGVNFSSVINTVAGNTSNALLIDSKNTSGTNTLTGSLFLDSDLRTLQQAGGTLAFTTGSTDIKGRKLTIDGAGNTSFSQVLSSSLAAGGSLVKTGSGILVLSNTSNNYTGTNSGTLNANGTQIAAGTLAIAADTSLGLAPSGAYNNIQFTGSGSLRSDANISLNANRNISVANGATATFDSNGNSLTVNGIVNGTGGAVTKTGAGTVTLTGNNTYSGVTTVSQGTLLINGANSSTAAVGVASGATLGGSGSVAGNVNVTGTLAPGNSIESLGTGAVNFLTGSTFAYELNSAALNGDLVDSTGVLDISGAVTLTLTQLASGTLANGSKLTLISYFGGWTSGELFTYNASTLADDSIFTLGPNQWQFNYNDTTGGTNFVSDQSGASRFVTMTVVPEPTSATLGLIGSLLLLRRRRSS